MWDWAVRYKFLVRILEKFIYFFNVGFIIRVEKLSLWEFAIKICYVVDSPSILWIIGWSTYLNCFWKACAATRIPYFFWICELLTVLIGFPKKLVVIYESSKLINGWKEFIMNQMHKNCAIFNKTNRWCCNERAMERICILFQNVFHFSFFFLFQVRFWTVGKNFTYLPTKKGSING